MAQTENTNKYVKHNLAYEKPVAGDVVYVACSTDIYVVEGMLGVIEGNISVASDEYSICFDPELPALITKETVRCIGGYRRTIKASDIHDNPKKNIFMLFKKESVVTQDNLDLVKRFFVTV